MSETSFKLVYDGEAVRDGEMDVADLAPALLAMGQMVKAAGRVTYGEDVDVRVRVQTMRDGSFEVWLSMAVDAAAMAWDFWKGDDVQAAATLAGLLGITVSGGVIGLVRALKGRTPKRLPSKSPEMARIETPDGVVEVPEAAVRIALDPSVRVAMERIIADPLEKDGIDTVLFGGATGGQKIEKDEAEFFRAPLQSTDDEYLSRYKRAFSIVQLNFTKGKKWKLSDGRGSAKLVLIEDEEFFARVSRNEERFAKGDILICDVVETSRRTASGFRSDYLIKKVLEHRPAPVIPPELPFDPKPGV